MSQKDQLNLPNYLIYREAGSSCAVYWVVGVSKDENGKVEYINDFLPLISKAEQLKNKHILARLLEGYKEKNCVKNCANLMIKRNNAGNFYPECTQSSLFWDSYELNQGPIGRNLKGELLTGCSSSCQFYSPFWKKKLINFITNTKNQSKWLIATVWKSFIGLPVPMQIIVGIGLLMLILPNAFNRIIEIYQILNKNFSN